MVKPKRCMGEPKSAIMGYALTTIPLPGEQLRLPLPEAPSIRYFAEDGDVWRVIDGGNYEVVGFGEWITATPTFHEWLHLQPISEAEATAMGAPTGQQLPDPVWPPPPLSPADEAALAALVPAIPPGVEIN
jgi:hypothetical protein